MPRATLTGDPYFTDGLRAVLWVSSEPVDLEDIAFVGWEKPPMDQGLASDKGL